MSMLARLLGRAPVERRDMGPLTVESLLGGQRTASGQYIGTTMAENLSAVSACVAAIAGSMGSLPPLGYRSTDEGRMELRSHWATRLLRRPNGWMTWPDVIEAVMGDVLLRGNGLLLIETDDAGRPVALVPIPWSGVQIEQTHSGRLIYVCTRPTAAWGRPEAPRRHLDSEIFHLKDRSDDGGFTGRSRISRAPDVVANAAALQQWSGSTWANQATPSGALEVEGSLSPVSFERLQAQFARKHTGPENARRPLILDSGLKWKSLSVSPEDAEVLSSRRFSIEEVARLFGVPPPIIGDLSHGTFTNSETLIRFFAQSTLATWCTKFEAEFARSVLGAANSDLTLTLDLSGLLRGDPEQRWNSYAIAATHNILSLDEIRDAEGYNPRLAAVPYTKSH